MEGGTIMKCVTYNIQYGIGLDGRYDIGRIVDAVRGADVIALQEVTRNSPRNEGRDMVAEIRDLLPEYFAVYGPNLETDVGSHVENGRAVDVHFQFGNMILSKTPILSSRNLLLPRTRSYGILNLQRGAIEALIETRFGPVRFYSTHLDHRGPRERLSQIRFLKERLIGYPVEGGSLTGTTELGFDELPVPEAYIAMGDFNMLEGSPEYEEMAGRVDHEFGLPLVSNYAVEAARFLAGPGATLAMTCVNMDDPADTAPHKRIDYCFVQASLAGNIRDCRVDEAAIGSDHRPVWLELG